MKQRVVLLDSGGANLASVQAAFARLGAEAPVTSDWNTIRDASHVVLPGVGTAAMCMGRLRENGLDKLVPRLTQPVIGICVGMQLLYERSNEDEDTECLGLLQGVVQPLQPSAGIRIPHMGWNQLETTGSSTHPLLTGLGGASVYFVHSFAARPGADTIATTSHGQPFSAVAAKGAIMGVQFHPERSSAAGARLLQNFLSIS